MDSSCLIEFILCLPGTKEDVFSSVKQLLVTRTLQDKVVIEKLKCVSKPNTKNQSLFARIETMFQSQDAKYKVDNELEFRHWHHEELCSGTAQPLESRPFIYSFVVWRHSFYYLHYYLFVYELCKIKITSPERLRAPVMFFCFFESICTVGCCNSIVEVFSSPIVPILLLMSIDAVVEICLAYEMEAGPQHYTFFCTKRNNKIFRQFQTIRFCLVRLFSVAFACKVSSFFFFRRFISSFEFEGKKEI